MSRKLVFEGKTIGYTLRDTVHEGRKHNDRHTCPDCRILQRGASLQTMRSVEEPKYRR
jgi:hypothetical protein